MAKGSIDFNVTAKVEKKIIKAMEIQAEYMGYSDSIIKQQKELNNHLEAKLNSARKKINRLFGNK